MERTKWTRRWVMRGWAWVAVVCVILAVPRIVCADKATETQGTALMDKYVEVTGGQAAYAAIKSRIVKGQRVMPDGAVRRFESYWVSPNKFRSIVELPVGALELGSDGKTVWVSFPTGATIVKDAHRVAVLRNSPCERFGRWRDVYQKAEYAGDETVDGTACSKVLLTYKPLDPAVPESPVTVFIAKDTGLIVRWTARTEDEEAGSEQETRAVMDLSDYRKVGDVRVPHRLKASARGEETSLTVEEVILNAEVPADKLALPAAIQEQLKEQESDK